MIVSILAPVALLLAVPTVFPGSAEYILRDPSRPVPSFLLVVLLLALVFLALSLWPRIVILLALCMTVGITLYVAARLFALPNYASFLQEIRSGGGIPVTVAMRSEDHKERQKQGFLMLVTVEQLILFDACASQFRELPRSDVIELTYGAQTDATLPPEKGSILNIFRHFLPR